MTCDRIDCNAYLGGGQCRRNLESECAEGGGYEAYSPPLQNCFGSLYAAAAYAETVRLPEGGFRIQLRADGRYILEVYT